VHVHPLGQQDGENQHRQPDLPAENMENEKRRLVRRQVEILACSLRQG
jgi:hypothetical protein